MKRNWTSRIKQDTNINLYLVTSDLLAIIGKEPRAFRLRKLCPTCKIWGCHSGGYEDLRLLGQNVCWISMSQNIEPSMILLNLYLDSKAMFFFFQIRLINYFCKNSSCHVGSVIDGVATGAGFLVLRFPLPFFNLSSSSTINTIYHPGLVKQANKLSQ
jgi:hypothetical protein